PRPIVEVFAGVAAEVLEGTLVRVEELRQRFVGARDVGAPSAVPERQDEDVTHDGLVAEADGGRAPVDLALQPRRGFEADERPLGAQPGTPRGLDEELHRVVAATVAAGLPELLKEDPGRVCTWKLAQDVRATPCRIRTVSHPNS